MVRSDRGVEFKNAMMAEFCALMQINQKFSAAMRPCELGSNERVHQEVQKVLHVLIKEVVHGDSDEWSELLPLVEFLLDNSPGAHGYTPRDLERSWSLGLDLEKDLIKESLEFEPIFQTGGDVSSPSFGSYRGRLLITGIGLLKRVPSSQTATDGQCLCGLETESVGKPRAGQRGRAASHGSVVCPALGRWLI